MKGERSTPHDALRGLLALFDDEGNFREQYQDQASAALEAAEAALKCVGTACPQWRHFHPCCGKDGRSD